MRLSIDQIDVVLGSDLKGMVVPLVMLKLGVRAKISDWMSKVCGLQGFQFKDFSNYNSTYYCS